MKIKVCGLTRKQDVDLAVKLKAWALGFIFYEKSPRAVSAESVRTLLNGVDPSIKKVGVFVNEKLTTIQRAIEMSGINTVQLHGEESVEYCKDLKRLQPSIELIKALRPKDIAELQEIPKFLSVVQNILIDTYAPEVRGGTGLTGDWDLAIHAKSYGPIILAGGLNSENVQAAIESIMPEALDVSSGLEDFPGVKSESKMRSFFQNALSQNALSRFK